METEILHFKIGLSGSSDKKHPEFSIKINDTQFVSGKLSSSKNQIEFFEFDAELAEGECNLEIEFKNKSNFDTVLDADGNIIEDLLLNIDSIEIDEINLGTLLWTASEYTPNYPAEYKIVTKAQGKELKSTVTNCVNLGWNGKWVLPFTSPFYIWLLDNI
jgi:hypothetical protein